MKSLATKSLKSMSPKSLKVAAPSLRPKSEVWIQHELDVAALNAEKNRSIQDKAYGRTTRPPSSSKKSVLKFAEDTRKAEPHISPITNSPTQSMGQIPSNKLQRESTFNKSHPAISKQELVEVHSTAISLIQTQLHSMIGEWSCAIKQAIFHEEIALNEDNRHATQLLILL